MERSVSRRVSRKRKKPSALSLKPQTPESDIFSTVMTWFQRPQWAMGSLLMGKFEEAGRHLAGFTGMSSLLDIDVPKLGPPASRVAAEYGFYTKKGSALRFGVDVFGGASIDPLTYGTLGLGGFTKLKVLGSSKKLATETLAYFLKPTSKLFKQARATFSGSNLPPSLLDKKAAEKVFEETLEGTDYFRILSQQDKSIIRGRFRSGDWQNLHENIWDAVLDKWRKTGELKESGLRVNVGLPFTEGIEVPGSRLAGKALASLTSHHIDFLTKGFVSKFLDKTETVNSNIPGGLKYVAQDYLQQEKRGRVGIAETIWAKYGIKGSQTWYNSQASNISQDLAELGVSELKDYRKALNFADDKMGEVIAKEMATSNLSIDGYVSRFNTAESAARHRAHYKKYKILEDANVHKLDPGRFEDTLSIPEIIYHRQIKQNKGVWHSNLKKYIDNYKSKAHETDIDPTWYKSQMLDYASDLFKDLSPRGGLISKLVAGGTIGPFRIAKKDRVRIGDITTSRKGPEGLGGTIASSLGKLIGLRWRHTKEGSFVTVPGFNNLWKMMLTTFPLNTSFHLRNLVGSVFMGAMDPDIGWSGVTALLKMGSQDKRFLALTSALHNDMSIASKGMAQVQALKAQGVQMGGRNIDEFLHIAKRALGGRVSHSAADITSEIGESFDLLNRADVGPLNRKYFFNMGENFANYTENHLRMHALARLLEKGVPEVDAVTRVQKQFVDYSIVSDMDRMLRDWIPFIKYKMGSMRWTSQMLQRPRQIAWVGKAQQSQDALLSEQQDPRSGEKKLFIPLPGGYRVNLGSGAESTIDMLRGVLPVGSPKVLIEGFRQGDFFRGVFPYQRDFGFDILTSSHPFYKAALEGILKRDIYTGRPLHVSKQAPPGLPKIIEDFVTKKTRRGKREYNAIAKALFSDLLPFGRQIRMVEKIILGKPLQAFTGVKRVTDFRARKQRLLVRRLRHLLDEASERGEVRVYTAHISAYPKGETPYELKGILSDYREQVKELKRLIDADRRGRR